jgi:hypothetical protein
MTPHCVMVQQPKKNRQAQRTCQSSRDQRNGHPPWLVSRRPIAKTTSTDRAPFSPQTPTFVSVKHERRDGLTERSASWRKAPGLAGSQLQRRNELGTPQFPDGGRHSHTTHSSTGKTTLIGGLKTTTCSAQNRTEQHEWQRNARCSLFLISSW